MAANTGWNNRLIPSTRPYKRGAHSKETTMKTNTPFESDAKRIYGITCREAIAKHLIEKSYVMPYGKAPACRGWEASNSSGTCFPTQFEALEHYFRVKAFQDNKHAVRIMAGPKDGECFRYRTADGFRLQFADGRSIELGLREMRLKIFELTEGWTLIDA